MKASRRRLLASGLGIGLLGMLFAVVLLDHRDRPPGPEALEYQEVNIYRAPPPPPPPPTSQDTGSGGLAGGAFTLAPNDVAVELDIMELEVKLATAGLDGLGAGNWGFGEGVGAGLETFSLSELDSTPVVMGAPPIIYPQEAIDEGVNEFEVLVQILIDQEGRTVPIRIVRNPYPSFEGDLHDFVSNVVFSPPTRLGVPVRAEYLWPIGIRQSMSRP